MTAADRARVAQEVARRHPRPRPARALPARPGGLRDHGQRPRPDLRRARRAASTRSDACFTDEAHLRRTIDKIVARVGRRVDEASPMVDARLPDGSRVNAVVPPIALDGSLLTIRKFAADPFTVDDLISFGTMTAAGGAAAARLRARAAEHRDRRRHRLRQDHHAERAVLASCPPTSGSSPSRTPPSCSCVRSTCCGWSRGRRTSRGAARSRSATWCATRCGCGRTGSSSARSATAPRSTCCRP